MAEGRGSWQCDHGLGGICMILILVSQYGQSGVCLPAVELKGDTSSLCLAEDEIPALRENFSLCAFLRPSQEDGQASDQQNVDKEGKETVDQDQNYTIFTLNQNSSSIRASLSASLLKVQYNNVSYTSEKLLPGVWRRLCVYIDPTTNKVVVYVRDRFSVAAMTDIHSTNEVVEVPRGFCLGSSSQGHKSFSGIVTAFSIQPGRSHIQPTDCSILVSPSALLTLSSSWVSTGNVRNFDYDAAQLCDEAFSLIFLRYPIGRRVQLEACESLGGRFMSVGEAKSASVNFTQALKSSCITDGKLVAWVAMNFSQLNVRSLCLVVLVNGSLTSHHCISELRCFLCLVPVDTRFTLFGLVRAHDDTYILQSRKNEGLRLTGEISEIVREGDRWALKSRLHSERWYLSGAPVPVGRHTWHFWNQKEFLNVTVTCCSMQEFSCDAGACISRGERCDGIRQCRDGSDEKSCEILKMTEGYNKNISPCGKEGQCKMRYDVSVYFISDITTGDGQATLDISLHLSWYDNRLNFQNLKKLEQDFDCEKIWVPSLIAKAGYSEGEISDLNLRWRTCAVNQNETNDYEYDLKDSMMGIHFSGSNILLHYKINFRLTFPCNFKLERYPFGSHVCNLSLLFEEKEHKMVFEKRPMTILNYTGSHDLLEFRLTQVTFETAYQTSDDVQSGIVISLRLQTLFEFHVLNSFAPSALMFFIVLSTLFYPISDFNERIMVSLTALLVLAALFTQASSSSVKTPYYKLLDVWYAALIVLCFIVVIINAVVHSLRKRKDGRVKVSPMVGHICFELSDSSIRRAAVCNMVSKIIVIVLFLSLVILYILFGVNYI